MVHRLALAGICARRNGINGGSLEGGTTGRGRPFMPEIPCSTFQHEPIFAPGLMRENFFDCLNG